MNGRDKFGKAWKFWKNKINVLEMVKKLYGWKMGNLEELEHLEVLKRVSDELKVLKKLKI